MGLDFKNFPGRRGQTKSATVRFFPGSAPDNKQLFQIIGQIHDVMLENIDLFTLSCC